MIYVGFCVAAEFESDAALASAYLLCSCFGSFCVYSSAIVLYFGICKVMCCCAVVLCFGICKAMCCCGMILLECMDWFGPSNPNRIKNFFMYYGSLQIDKLL